VRLGAVLAGGRSSRFGSDKALARIGSETLLERGVRVMSYCCDYVVVVGRKNAPAPSLPDWPGPDAGPLGGIAAALRHASKHGYATVLTIGVDTIGLPDGFAEALTPAPAYLEGLPVVGHWPVWGIDGVQSILRGPGKHSMRAFAAAIGARPVKFTNQPANINTPADLAAAELLHGL
jgi:molybdopterin-guanine dinucleotide biosynthesis protein A